MSQANELIGQILRASAFTITGRVGQDPELKYFQSGTCKVSLSLAVNRLGAKKDDGVPPDWFKAEFWGPDAEEVTNLIRKGDLLRVTGRIKSDRWTTRDGAERTDLVINVDEWAQIVNGQPVYRDAPEPVKVAEAVPVTAAGRPAAVAPVAAADDDIIPF